MAMIFLFFHRFPLFGNVGRQVSPMIFLSGPWSWFLQNFLSQAKRQIKPIHAGEGRASAHASLAMATLACDYLGLFLFGESKTSLLRSHGLDQRRCNGSLDFFPVTGGIPRPGCGLFFSDTSASSVFLTPSSIRSLRCDKTLRNGL